MVKVSDFKIYKNSKFETDFNNYENTTQSALNKKLLKWKNIIDEYKGLDPYRKKFYFKKELNFTFEKGDNVLWLKYLYFIQLNLIIANKFYENRKPKLEIINKAKSDNYLKVKISCECGGSYTNRNKAVHCKTKRHIIFISEQENDEDALI
jgi:hypothetical protein